MCLHVMTRIILSTPSTHGTTSNSISVSSVPGDPQDVKVVPINSTTIQVSWKPPLAKDRNGIIHGYHVHVQETKEEVYSYDVNLKIQTYLYVMDQISEQESVE